MKVLYVWWGNVRGPFHFRSGSRPPDEYYVEEAAKKLGLDVVRTHYNDSKLLEKTQKEQPHILLFSHPPDKYPFDERIPKLREAAPDAVAALLSFDFSGYEGDPTREKRYLGLLKHLDVFCTKETGRRVFWSQRGVPACRAVQGHHPWVESIWEPHKDGVDPRPVVFLGSHSSRRDQILGQLKGSLGNDLVVHSQTGGWTSVKQVKGGVFGPERDEVIRNASCVIDITNAPGIPGFYSDRIPDMLAYGIPLLAESTARHSPEFQHGKHLIWWTNPASLPIWIAKVRGDWGVAKRLSEEGSRWARKYFTYEQTVREVVDACSLVREATKKSWVSFVKTEKPKRSNVLVLGQWRPQGLGYIARRIVDVVEGAGGSVKVASVNRNPEWDAEHRFDRDGTPPDSTQSIIFLEKCDDTWLRWAQSKNVQTIYMPMWELFRPEPEERWCRHVDIVTAVPHAQIQAKIGKEVIPLEWDPGLQPRRPIFQEVPCFFHDARGTEQGQYDLRPRQNTKAILKAYKKAEKHLLEKERREIRLVVRVKNRPLEGPTVPASCQQYEFDDTRDYFFSVAGSCSAALCPTGPEGFGLPTFEYQALSVPPICLNVPPANQIVNHGVDGWLVDADDMGPASLARKWEPNVDALAQTIIEASDPKKLREIREGAYSAALARVGTFDRFLLGLLNR